MSDTFLTSLAPAQAAALQQFGVRIAVDVAAIDEPITLEDAYAHLHIDFDSNGSAEDGWLGDQIPAAREYCQGYLGRALAPLTMELSASAFPTAAFATPPGPYIALPFGPVTGIVSLLYTDSDGLASQVFEDTNGPLYELDTYVTPARLIAKYGETWPTAQVSQNAVVIRYTAGYIREADTHGTPVLPRLARSAMLLILGAAYKEREGQNFQPTIDAAHTLLDMVPNRERLGFA